MENLIDRKARGKVRSRIVRKPCGPLYGTCKLHVDKGWEEVAKMKKVCTEGLGWQIFLFQIFLSCYVIIFSIVMVTNLIPAGLPGSPGSDPSTACPARAYRLTLPRRPQHPAHPGRLLPATLTTARSAGSNTESWLFRFFCSCSGRFHGKVSPGGQGDRLPDRSLL